jgi:hypothetical protein
MLSNRFAIVRIMAALCFLALVAAAWAASIEVTTEYGRIKGREEIDPGVVVRFGSEECARLVATWTENNDHSTHSLWQAYYGIPFASPPVDELRFKAPITPNPWTNVRDCTHDSYFHVS